MAKIIDIYGKELWSDDKPTVRESVLAAVASCANLSGANLSGANLSGADLRCADLRCANLSGADLRSADLSGANLSCANLSGANLSGADLRCADLRCADLSGADLRSANLRCANLRCADLSGADLSGARGVNPHRCTPLLMLLDQPGPIRAYKLVNENSEGHINGGIKYVIGERVEVSDANTDATEHCAAGVNVATLDWCMREWRAGYRILVVEFTASDIAAIPTATDGKFRLHRCAVVGEKDLAEIGLVKEVAA
jgi:hypothetical protein